MAETTYTIQSRPPVRAFVIAAVGALLGALLLVLAIAQGWHLVVAILGGVLLAAGVALLIVAFMSMQRLAVHLTLDDDGYRLVGPGDDHEGEWADVSKVTQSEDSVHVTIYHGSVRRTHLLFSRPDAEIDRVLDDIKERLESRR